MIPALPKQSSACNACARDREPGREINNREVRQEVSRQVGESISMSAKHGKGYYTNKSSNNSTSVGIEGYGGIETILQILFKMKKGK